MARSDIDWSSRPGSNLIDLGEQGLSNGDSLDSYVEQYFRDGNQVYIPPGEYDFNEQSLHGDYSDCCLVGDPAGVVGRRPDPETQLKPTTTVTGGLVQLENITIRGKKGICQSRLRFDVPGGDFRMKNYNYPDGTRDPSDSGVFYHGGGSGTIYMEDCYIGPHGNSSAYCYYGDAYLVVDGCTFVNSNSCIRPSPAGAEIRNTKFIADGHVPCFSQDCNPNCESVGARLLKQDRNSRVSMENIHIYVTDDVRAVGNVLGNNTAAPGELHGLRLYNETNESLWTGIDGWETSDIHVSGPGNTNFPHPVDGSEMPDHDKVVWTPEGGAPAPCESDDDCPAGRVCDGGDCVPPVISVDGDQPLAVLNSERNSQTNIRQVHAGYNGAGFIDLEPRDGAWAVWHLDVIEDGEYDLQIRYSNGSGNARTCALIVGNSRQQITFPDTGGWESWDTITATVDLPPGQIEFGFETTGEDAGQIDTVELLEYDPCRGVECGANEVCIDGDCISENEAPTSDFSTSVDGLQVTVHPDASDPDGNIVEYEVDWDDGTVTTQPSGVSQAHTYDASGDYTIMLTVTDAGGLSHSRTRTVTVDEPGPCDGVDCPSGEECVDGECVPVDGGDGPGLGTLGLLLGLAAAGGWVMYNQQDRDGQ